MPVKNGCKFVIKFLHKPMIELGLQMENIRVYVCI